MSRLPIVSYVDVIRILQKEGFVVVRQKGSHIRLQKHAGSETLKITVPAHSPLKRGTLRRILKDSRISVKRFKEML